MKVVAFTTPESVLARKCNGEASALFVAAERQENLAEKARKSVEEICRHCESVNSDVVSGPKPPGRLTRNQYKGVCCKKKKPAEKPKASVRRDGCGNEVLVR